MSISSCQLRSYCAVLVPLPLHDETVIEDLSEEEGAGPLAAVES
jgi:hypothetical protein